MSSILVSGILVNPFNRPLPNAIITLTSISNSFTVLTGASVTSRTNDAGEYEFHLQPGNYAVYVAKDSYRDFYGAITTTPSTPPTTLNVLLKQNAMEAEVPPDLVEFFQQVQNQVVVVGNGADEAAKIAIEKAGEAAASEQNAGTHSTAAVDAASSAGESASISQEIANQLGGINQFIKDAGFNPVDSFEQGHTLESIGQALRFEATGAFYSWRGFYPKVVPAGSTPESSGGISKTAWVDVNDLTFRSQAAAVDGFKLIGRCPDVATLRNTEPTSRRQIINLASYNPGWTSKNGKPLGGGDIYFDEGDHSSIDDGVITFVTTNGARWKRIVTGDITFEMAGAVGDGVTDDTIALQRAFDLMLFTGKTICATNSGSRYLFSSQLTIYAGAGKLVMDRARFVANHAKMTSGFAIRVMGNPNNVYNLGCELEIRLQGPYGGELVSRPPINPEGTLDGIGFYPGDNTQVSTVLVKLWVEGFRRNLYIGNKSVYLLQFHQLQCGKFWESGVYMDCSEDAGENISFHGGVIFNGMNAAGDAACIRVPGTGQYLNAHFYGVSFDYSDLVFDIKTGVLTFHGGQFENNSSNPYGILQYVSTKRKPQAYMMGLTIDGGNDLATVYTNQGDATGKRIWFKNTGGAAVVAIGGAWGKYHKMKDATIVDSTGAGSLILVRDIYFDMAKDYDRVNIGTNNNSLRNYAFATGDLTGWVTNSFTSNPSGIVVTPLITYDANTALGPAARLLSNTSGGETTTMFGQRFPVQAGSRLYASSTLIWKNINASNGSAYFSYEFFDGQGNTIVRNNIGVNLNTQPATNLTPTVCSNTITVPPGAVSVFVGLRHYQCSGEVMMGPVYAFAS